MLLKPLESKVNIRDEKDYFNGD